MELKILIGLTLFLLSAGNDGQVTLAKVLESLEPRFKKTH